MVLLICKKDSHGVSETTSLNHVCLIYNSDIVIESSSSVFVLSSVTANNDRNCDIEKCDDTVLVRKKVSKRVVLEINMSEEFQLFSGKASDSLESLLSPIIRNNISRFAVRSAEGFYSLSITCTTSENSNVKIEAITRTGTKGKKKAETAAEGSFQNNQLSKNLGEFLSNMFQPESLKSKYQPLIQNLTNWVRTKQNEEEESQEI
jgi:hypothetical protein